MQDQRVLQHYFIRDAMNMYIFPQEPLVKEIGMEYPNVRVHCNSQSEEFFAYYYDIKFLLPMCNMCLQ